VVLPSTQQRMRAVTVLIPLSVLAACFGDGMCASLFELVQTQGSSIVWGQEDASCTDCEAWPFGMRACVGGAQASVPGIGEGGSRASVACAAATTALTVAARTHSSVARGDVL